MARESGRLTTIDGRAWTLDGGASIPCFRCGVCCEKWSPLLDGAEAGRIAARLGLATEELVARYADAYPLREDTYILRHTDRGCVFLDHDDNGLASCAIHDFKPDACRAFEAGLDRQECLEGLRRIGDGAIITLDELYAEDEPRTAFERRLGSVRD